MTPLVLFDHEMFALQRFGGITRVFVELMRRLAEREDVAVAWHRGFHVDDYVVDSFSPRLVRYWGMPAAGLVPGALADGELNLVSLRAFGRTLTRPVDLLHSTYFDPRIPDAVPHRKLAITVHDLIPELYFGGIPRFQPLLSDRAQIIARSDLIFVNSAQTQADLQRFFPTAKAKVELTPWASSLGPVIPSELPSAVAALTRPFLLYVGTRSKYKNFQVLLDAFARDRSLRQRFDVVVFGGSGAFLEPEQKFLFEHGLQESFLYLTGGDEVLKALYRSAAALVYTSRYEGFGLPPLEALENGCPVVCCGTSSLPEVVGDCALFFEPDSPAQLATQLGVLATDSAVAARLRLAGPVRASGFSWERTVEATVAAYASVAA